MELKGLDLTSKSHVFDQIVFTGHCLPILMMEKNNAIKFYKHS